MARLLELHCTAAQSWLLSWLQGLKRCGNSSVQQLHMQNCICICSSVGKSKHPLVLLLVVFQLMLAFTELWHFVVLPGIQSVTKSPAAIFGTLGVKGEEKFKSETNMRIFC